MMAGTPQNTRTPNFLLMVMFKASPVADGSSCQKIYIVLINLIPVSRNSGLCKDHITDGVKRIRVCPNAVSLG